MSCQSWWCGGDTPVELGRTGAQMRVMLTCGCAVRPQAGSGDPVPVTFETIACDAHRTSAPDALPAGTRVRIDLLAALLEQGR